jgi:hypothetical protein
LLIDRFNQIGAAISRVGLQPDNSPLITLGNSNDKKQNKINNLLRWIKFLYFKDNINDNNQQIQSNKSSNDEIICYHQTGNIYAPIMDIAKAIVSKTH